MLRASRHLLYLLPLALANILFVVFALFPATSHAQSNQQVTVGVGATTLTINGQTSPDAFVTVLRDTTPIGTTSAGTDGTFSITLTFENGGINQISVFSETPDGAVSDPLTTNVNVIGHQETTMYALLPSSITLESTQLTLGQSVKASGETIPGGAVTLSTDTGHTAQVTADASGIWTASLPTTSAGLRYLVAVVSDDQNRQSPPTRQVAYVVSEVTPQPTLPTPITPIVPIRPSPPAEAPVTPTLPIISSPQNNQYINTRTLVVRGSATSGNLVELWQDGRVAGSAFASSNNTWQISVNLSGSSTSLRARACRLGVCSDFSPAVNVYFSAGTISGSLFTILDVPEYNFTAPIADRINLPLLIDKGKAPYQVRVDWGDETFFERIFQKAGRYTLTHSYAEPGLYNGMVTVKDSNNVTDVHQFAVEVKAPRQNSLLDETEERIAIAIVVLLALRLLLPYLIPRFKRLK